MPIFRLPLFFLALLFFCSHSFSTQTTQWDPVTSGFFHPTSVNLSYGDFFADTTLKLADKGGMDTVHQPISSPTGELISLSYKDLISAIFKKISADIPSSFSRAQKISLKHWESSYKFMSDTSVSITRNFLWIVVWLWCQVYLWIAKTLWFFATYFTLPVLALAILTCLTAVVYRVLRWICSQLPMRLLLLPWTTMKFVVQMRSSKKKTKIVMEKACEGFTTYSIPQTPTKNSVVEIVYSDGSHAGYATCVQLYNGHRGLLTAHHVQSASDMAVHSLRNGNKIKLDDFKIIFSNSDLDLVLYMGPPSWESSLSCSGVNMVCVNRLSMSKTLLFGFEDGEWRAKNGKITGTFEKKVTVLSDTAEGDSGSAYFNGKNVVGVHLGYPASGENFNLMAPIPNIPGITSSKLVFETTAPQGRVFDEETLKYFEDLCEEFSHEEARYIMRNRNIKYESAPQNQGRGAQRRLRNKRRSKHPKDKEREYLAAPSNPINLNSTRTRGYDGQNFGGIVEKDQHSCYRNENRRESGSSHNKEQIPREARWKEEASNFREYFRSIYNWQIPTTPLEIPGFREVGATPQYYYAKQKQESRWGRKLTEQHPELAAKTAGFGWPEFGPKAELKSLRLQASRWLDRAQCAKTPSDAEREHVINQTVSAYAAAKTPTPSFCLTETLKWSDFIEEFKLAILSLELEAGVGVPFVAYGKRTHRDWVENPQLLPVLARMTFDRLQKISEVNFEAMTPEELVQNGLCDPIRLFVKGEPHKQSKLDEGRYRLIMSVSLLDQLVARVLFQSQNKLEIALWRAVPSKPGFGLSTDDQIEDFTNCLAKQVGETADEVIPNWQNFLVPTDCSGFDWSVSDWLLEDDMEVRNRLTINCTPLLRRLRAGWLKCISNSVLCLSDGTLLAQTVPGVQKSGSYNTSSSNSRIRVMAAYHSGASWAMAMGDDALESVDTDLSVYKDLGFKVEVSEQLEFCSHIFKERNLAIPVNTNKMLYKLIHGYDPECGNIEVLNNYLNAVVSVMGELRHDQALVSKLFQWLVPSAATK
nr:putative RNA-dependent RNA polymerase P1-P2 fusion protein [Carrot polerovirus 2]